MKFGSYEQGQAAVIVPREAIIESECDQVRFAVAEAATNGADRVVVDLSDVPFIDSAGLELFCELREACANSGGRLRLACASEILLEILRITELRDQFDVFSSVEAAATSLT